MDISELLTQRKRTRAIAEVLARELDSYLQAVAPLMNPRSVFGEHVHGSQRNISPQGSKALDTLKAQYDAVRQRAPFNLRQHFDSPITMLATAPEIHPVRFRYTAKAGGTEKRLLVTSPLRWVLSYEGFGIDRLRGALKEGDSHDGPSLQDHVLHQLMLAITLQLKPGIGTLFAALRFPLTVEHWDEFGALPIVVISAPLATHLPEDGVIIDSTEISGSSDFEEIVVDDPSGRLPDPLNDRIQAATQR